MDDIDIEIGDIVSRKSHNHDVLFKVVRIESDELLVLKGIALRLLANAPSSDLVRVNSKRVETLAETRERLVSTRKRKRHVALDT